MRINRITPLLSIASALLLSSCGTPKSDMEKIYDFYSDLKDTPVILDEYTKLEITDLNYGLQGYHIASDITIEKKNYEISVQPGDTYLYTNVIDFKLTLEFASCSKPDDEGFEPYLGDDIALIDFKAKYGDGKKSASEVEDEKYLKDNFFTTDKDCNLVFKKFDDAPITRSLMKIEVPRVLKLYKNWLSDNKLSLDAVNGLKNLK